jgi:hypothetical protein
VLSPRLIPLQREMRPRYIDIGQCSSCTGYSYRTKV